MLLLSHLYMDLLIVDYIIQWSSRQQSSVRSRLLCWLRGWVRSVQCKLLSIMSCFWFVLADFFCIYVIASLEIHISGLKAVFWPCGNREAWGVSQFEIGCQLILGDEVAVGRLSVSSKEQWVRSCADSLFFFMAVLNLCQDSQKMASCLQKTAS